MTKREFANQLYNLQYQLRPFAYRFTGDWDAANELLQETLVRAYVGRHRFKQGTNFKGWVYAIMRNTHTTAYRRSQLWHKLTSTHQAPLIDHRKVSHNAGISALTHTEFKHALARLSAATRRAFLMYYRGFKYREIACSLNLPLGTVKNRIHIARRQLKQTLAAYA